MNQLPPSPPSDPGTTLLASKQLVPLDSPIRTTPIHPDLPNIRVPGEPLPSYSYDPVSCVAIDPEEVRVQLNQLRRDYPTREAALKAQEQAAKEAKAKIEWIEKKREEIREKIDKKVKERDTEMKVLSKYREESTNKHIGMPTSEAFITDLCLRTVLEPLSPEQEERLDRMMLADDTFISDQFLYADQLTNTRRKDICSCSQRYTASLARRDWILLILPVLMIDISTSNAIQATFLSGWLHIYSLIKFIRAMDSSQQTHIQTDVSHINTYG